MLLFKALLSALALQQAVSAEWTKATLRENCGTFEKPFDPDTVEWFKFPNDDVAVQYVETNRALTLPDSKIAGSVTKDNWKDVLLESPVLTLKLMRERLNGVCAVVLDDDRIDASVIFIPNEALEYPEQVTCDCRVAYQDEEEPDQFFQYEYGFTAAVKAGDKFPRFEYLVQSNYTGRTPLEINPCSPRDDVKNGASFPAGTHDFVRVADVDIGTNDRVTIQFEDETWVQVDLEEDDVGEEVEVLEFETFGDESLCRPKELAKHEYLLSLPHFPPASQPIATKEEMERAGAEVVEPTPRTHRYVWQMAGTTIHALDTHHSLNAMMKDMHLDKEKRLSWYEGMDLDEFRVEMDTDDIADDDDDEPIIVDSAGLDDMDGWDFSAFDP